MKFNTEYFDNILSKYELTSLRKLQLKAIFYLSILFSSYMGITAIIRIIYAQYDLAITVGTSVILNLLIVYLLIRGKHKYAVALSCVVLTVTSFTLVYFKIKNPAYLVFPHFTLVVAWYLILILDKLSNLAYYSISVLLLMLICYSFELTFFQSYPIVFQISGAWLTFYLLSRFLINQENELSQAHLELKEKHLEQSEYNQVLKNKNNELKTFNHIMSHDLKAPLRSVNSFVGLLKTRLNPVDSKCDEYFQFINNSCTKMQELIDDLLSLQSVNNNNEAFRNIYFTEIIAPILDHYHFELSDNKLKISIDPIPTIYGNKVLLVTLFKNLISNSIKYQPNNEAHIPKIEIRGQKIDNFAQIQLVDNGIGIEPEYISDLFNPFKRYHSENIYSGSGLGLSICKRVVEKHNGSIEVLDSGVNGSTFQIKLPINQSTIQV